LKRFLLRPYGVELRLVLGYLFIQCGYLRVVFVDLLLQPAYIGRRRRDILGIERERKGKKNGRCKYGRDREAILHREREALAARMRLRAASFPITAKTANGSGERSRPVNA